DYYCWLNYSSGWVF
nr:immunoglobulin light chain junction region [Macaca mulatta]MOW58740.1 immunoglobulin light chain junction region [Macaca mulatta]MOW60390.1 immunoglobulin light chain junction region [Macaca mulatta]MOW60881.1 immunoglobulin light chain junction region [Macaca mulatta]